MKLNSFIAALALTALIAAALNVGFEAGQENPDAKSPIQAVYPEDK